MHVRAVTPNDVSAVLHRCVVSETAPYGHPIIRRRIPRDLQRENAGSRSVIEAINSVDAALRNRLHLLVGQPLHLVFEPRIEVDAHVLGAVDSHDIVSVALLGFDSLWADRVPIGHLPQTAVFQSEAVTQLVSYDAKSKWTINPTARRPHVRNRIWRLSIIRLYRSSRYVGAAGPSDFGVGDIAERRKDHHMPVVICDRVVRAGRSNCILH